MHIMLTSPAQVASVSKGSRKRARGRTAQARTERALHDQYDPESGQPVEVSLDGLTRDFVEQVGTAINQGTAWETVEYDFDFRNGCVCEQRHTIFLLPKQLNAAQARWLAERVKQRLTRTGEIHGGEAAESLTNAEFVRCGLSTSMVRQLRKTVRYNSRLPRPVRQYSEAFFHYHHPDMATIVGREPRFDPWEWPR